MGGLADEDEAFLDEGGDGVVGGEEEEADGEDEEAEAVGDSLHAFGGVGEHGGHHYAHHCEDYEAGEEELRGAPDVFEVAAHQDPGLGQERIGEFWGEVLVVVVVVVVVLVCASGFWCAVVVFIDGVVAAVRRGGARKNLA